MKKSAIIITIILQAIISYCQDDCEFEPEKWVVSYPKLKAGGITSDIQYFPLQIHIIRKDDGTTDLNEGNLIPMIKMLNESFIKANVQFYLCDEYNYIDSTDLYVHEYSKSDRTKLAPFQKNNAINVYFADVYRTFPNNLAGYARFPF